MNRFIEKSVVTSSVLIDDLTNAIETNDNVEVQQSLELAKTLISDLKAQLEDLQVVNIRKGS